MNTHGCHTVTRPRTHSHVRRPVCAVHVLKARQHRRPTIHTGTESAPTCAPHASVTYTHIHYAQRTEVGPAMPVRCEGDIQTTPPTGYLPNSACTKQPSDILHSPLASAMSGIDRYIIPHTRGPALHDDGPTPRPTRQPRGVLRPCQPPVRTTPVYCLLT